MALVLNWDTQIDCDFPAMTSQNICCKKGQLCATISLSNFVFFDIRLTTELTASTEIIAIHLLKSVYNYN